MLDEINYIDRLKINNRIFAVDEKEDDRENRLQEKSISSCS